MAKLNVLPIGAFLYCIFRMIYYKASGVHIHKKILIINVVSDLYIDKTYFGENAKNISLLTS